MAQRPDAYGYHTPPEQQDFLDAAYKKADRITARHSGGDDYITSAYKSPYADTKTSTVDLMHIPDDKGTVNQVGRVQWNTQSGHVHWMGVDNGHRHMVPKLLSAAKAHADAEGFSPPSNSSDMTGYSYKLAKRYAPEHIPEDAAVHYRPLSVKTTDFHKASEHINTLHAMAMADAPGHAEDINSLASAAHYHVDEARRIHRDVAPEKDRGENYNYHIGNATNRLERLSKYVPDQNFYEHPAVTRAVSHFNKMDGMHFSDY